MRSVLVIASLGILAVAIASLGACASILGIEEIDPPSGVIDAAAHDASDSGAD